MDRPTLAAYEADARTYAERWLAQEEPADLYALLRCYFRPGLTADIGCGMSSTPIGDGSRFSEKSCASKMLGSLRSEPN